MEKRFFTDNEHPAVVQEHEDVYISSDGREIVAKANRITEYAAKPRWKKIGHSILSTAIATGINMIFLPTLTTMRLNGNKQPAGSWGIIKLKT
jgi:hypothetical protein